MEIRTDDRETKEKLVIDAAKYKPSSVDYIDHSD